MKKYYTLFALITAALFSAAQPARLQVIQNAADPTLQTVDVWVNDTLWLDNFAFKTATPFVDIPGNGQLALTLRPANNFNIILASQYINPTPGQTFVALIQGVSGGGFINNPDPDAATKVVDFYLYTGAKEQSASQNTVELLIAHGSTDCQKTDFNLQGLATVADNLSYGDFDNGYTSVPAANYMLDITPAASANPLATYNVNLTGWAGKAAVVFTSGFYNPSNNNNGPIFQLCYAMADGTTNCFNFLSGLEENSLANGVGLYPNPATTNTTFEYTLNTKSSVTITLMDATGRVVERIDPGTQNAGLYKQTITTENYPAGLYLVKLQAGGHTRTKPLAVTK